MARKYSGAKGRSGSKKPIEKAMPAWMGHKPKEIEKLVVKIAKTGKSASEIGIYLRDVYGIPSIRIATKKKLAQVLRENKVEKQIPDDLMALIKRDIAIRKHLEANHKDNSAKRGLEITESKIRKMISYQKKIKRLPADWKFEPDRIKLYVE